MSRSLPFQEFSIKNLMNVSKNEKKKKEWKEVGEPQKSATAQ